jgi:hypothetical protein
MSNILHNICPEEFGFKDTRHHQMEWHIFWNVTYDDETRF